MGNSESNESAAVKRQAEGGANPMYTLLDLSGGGILFHITKRAMVKKDYKELDEAIKAKIQPFLYNGGKGKMVPIAQLSLLRNRDRSKSKQLPVVKELGDEAFSYVFEGSELLAKLTEGLDPVESPHLFRECCWMVEKRGFCGETAFHVCFLMQTPTHLTLARRLLKHYPKLINDVYLSEEYYGENVLHMSVVAEDPTMTKYLLDEGIFFHERAYGNFFCPEDQKSTRNDSLDHEVVHVNPQTNYEGYVAWGEYPLSFAAVLSQEECYRLILSRGGNHDLQDTNGNTVTHIMVVFNNMKMFDMAVECGATINTTNNLNMTPLTVAAYLARMEMFFHIANIEREVYWQIGNVTCSAYPIEQLDTINSSTGELNLRSALNLIVFGKLTEHLDLIEGVVVDLLQTKWKSFIKRSFFRQLYAYTVFFLVAIFCFVTRPSAPIIKCDHNETNLMSNGTSLGYNSTTEFYTTLSWKGKSDDDPILTTLPDPGLLEEELSSVSSIASSVISSSSVSSSVVTVGKKISKREVSSAAPVVEDDPQETTTMTTMTTMKPPYRKIKKKTRCFDPKFACYLHTYTTFMEQARVIAEIIVVAWSLLYILIAIREFSFLGYQVFMENMALCPSRVVFLMACILVQAAPPLRIMCMQELENLVAICVMFSNGFYFLFFCRGFKLTGPTVIMIYRMMAADLLRFVAIYFIFVMGFAQAYYIIFQSYHPDDPNQRHPMVTPVESVIAIFIMSLGAFGGIWNGSSDTHHPLSGKILCFLFLSVVFVLLVNLLIAMMGDTYTKIAEIKNEWMRQWARTVLIVERGIPPKERLRQQDLYSERMATGEKALVLKQTLSDEQVEEIRDIIEMKVIHRRNIIKRKAKWGFESNSLIGLDLAGAANVIAPDAVDDEEY